LTQLTRQRKLYRKKVYQAKVQMLQRWIVGRKLDRQEAEEELKEWITQTYGRSKYLELLKIRREVLAEKREAEAEARRDAIQRQEMAITVIGIIVLLIFTFVGAVFYLHFMNWLDIRDWIR